MDNIQLDKMTLNDLRRMQEAIEKLTSEFDRLSSELMPTKALPETKVIDLSFLIESMIDCELWDDNGPKYFNTLDHITSSDVSPVYENGNDAWDYCQPRMSPHIHYWRGGVCPLPEGFVVKVYYCNGDAETIDSPENCDWEYIFTAFSDTDIIGFEVMGVAKGWTLPFHEELNMTIDGMQV